MAVTQLPTSAEEPAPYERKILRIGAAGAVIGPAAILIASIIHPKLTNSEEEALRTIHESSVWVPVHVVIVVSFFFYLAGLIAVWYSLSRGRSRALAHFALASALIGGAVTFPQLALDGFSLSESASRWADASAAQKPAEFAVWVALDELQLSLLGLVLMVFFGVTFVLYGLTVALGDRYSTRLGWVAAAAGTGSFVTGLVLLIAGISTAIVAIFPIFIAVNSLWLVTIGILLWRQTSRAAITSARRRPEPSMPASGPTA